MPPHTHGVSATLSGSMRAAPGPATGSTAAGNALSARASNIYTGSGQPTQIMQPGTVEVTIDTSTAPSGGGQPFDSRSPYLALSYCIVTEGLFPSRP